MTTAQLVDAIRQRWPRTLTVPRQLSRVQWTGYAVLGLQFAGFIAWSTVQYQRFAVTYDFSMFHQAWYLIAHGDLDPFCTVKFMPFWRDHSEFLVWPLALLYWVYPQGVMLLWVQDACIALAELAAFTWICREARKRCPGTSAPWLCGLGIVLLSANPWTWWSIGWDFHTETLAMPFAVMLAWDLLEGRRRVWVWVLPLLLCGDVAATYVAGLGLGGLLAGPRSRVRGAILVGIGIAATVAITLVHGNLGSGGGLKAYGYLAGASAGTRIGLPALVKAIASHPWRIVRILWPKRLDLWANLGPAGLLGVTLPLFLPFAAVVLLADFLYPGLLFAVPGFQNLPLYIFLPVGTVSMLGWMAQRHRRAARLLSGLVAVQALGWAVAWFPVTPSQWLRVSAPAAATLARVDARIPQSANVLVSQGVVGRFAGRGHIEVLMGAGALPVQEGENWFVIAPVAGIETMSTASAFAFIAELAGPLHATLVIHANDVWAFRWTPPAGTRDVTVPNGFNPLPAWAADGAAGLPVLSGPVSGWHMAATGGKGYVTDGLAWQEPPGLYRAAVTLSAAGPVNVEVWDDTTGALVSRRSVTQTTGIQQVVMPVPAPRAADATAFHGWGLFRASFLPPPSGQRLEVRVWSPGGEAVNVYSAVLTAVSSSDPAANS